MGVHADLLKSPVCQRACDGVKLRVNFLSSPFCVCVCLSFFVFLHPQVQFQEEPIPGTINAREAAMV